MVVSIAVAPLLESPPAATLLPAPTDDSSSIARGLCWYVLGVVRSCGGVCLALSNCSNDPTADGRCSSDRVLAVVTIAVAVVVEATIALVGVCGGGGADEVIVVEGCAGGPTDCGGG